MDIWLLYLLIVLFPGINTLFKAVFIISCVVLVVSVIIFLIWHCAEADTSGDHEKVNEYMGKFAKWFIPIYLVVCCVFVAAPSARQIAYLVGGYFVTNAEDIENLPPNMIKAANKFLEDFYNAPTKEEKE